MGELKSSWDIAQERANRLGKLSTEEREQQERQMCQQIGEVLAQKWLDGSQPLDMTVELNKHEEEKRNIIKQGITERLVKAIEFTNTQGIDTVEKILGGISSLEPELQPKTEEMRQLVQEYKGAERNMSQEIERKYRETLHQLRISGTAVAAINSEANPEWQLAQQKLLEAFIPRLNDLKQGLISSS